METKKIGELFDLSGKVAVVTGGAMGIGFGIVRRLAEAGAKVVIADVAREGEAKAKELGAVFVETDVTSEMEVRNMVKEVVKRYNHLDIFVNNAGIFPQTPVLQMTSEFWEKIQEVNLRGMFLCNREAGAVMAKQKSGSIINIGSIDSLHPSNVGLAAYDASKHGLWGFSKNFALEMAKYNVRVNVIAPGGVATEGVAKSMNLNDPKGQQFDEAMKGWASSVPLGRLGQPDDIAKVALFLASEAAAYMTGSIVVVDGGELLT